MIRDDLVLDEVLANFLIDLLSSERFSGLCRYGIALTGMSLAVLIGEGWQGPLSVMLTLALPPEIKSFAISLFFAIAQLIGPAGSVLFGIYLTVSRLHTALGKPATEDSPLGSHRRVYGKLH